ncbi:secretin N-terminal domain-containing protein, partial [Planctomycetota bacterium]
TSNSRPSFCISSNVARIVEGEDNPKAPIVAADTLASSLIVRGTKDQIADIKLLLNKMGEDGAMLGGSSTASNVRMLDLTGREAQMALEQAALIWPTLRGNKIRSVTPSNAINAMNNSIIEERNSPVSRDEDQKNPAGEEEEEDSTTPIAPPLTGNANLSRTSTDTLFVQTPVRRFPKPTLVAQTDARALASDGPTNNDETNNEKTEATPGVVNVPGSDIIIAPGPGGLMVTSKDTEALADFVDLLDMLTENMSSSASKSFTVFYLKHETANNAMNMLNEILGAGSSGGGGGGGGLLGDIAGAALGGGGGGDLVGSLLGLGGDSGSSVEASGPFKIVANTRLNCLVVEANPVDIELIEQLLVVIDRKKSLEVIQTSPTPRIVQIQHQPAETIANILKGSYADRLVGGGGGQQQPNPQDIIRAMTRGRGGDNGGGGQDPEEAKKNISIEVDAANNTLIIGAPDDTFVEMKSLIDQLDQTAQTTQIVPIRNADPALLRQVLGAYIGEGTTGGTTRGGGSTPGAAGGRPGSPAASGGQAQRSAQQQAAAQEIFRAMQQRAGGSNRGQGQGGGTRGGRGGATGGRGGGGRGGR